MTKPSAPRLSRLVTSSTDGLRFIRIPEWMVDEFGGFSEAIVLQTLIDHCRHLVLSGQIPSDRAPFFMTVDKLEARTRLKESAQRRILGDLEKSGVLSSKVCGVPPRRHISLNIERLESIIQAHIDRLESDAIPQPILGDQGIESLAAKDIIRYKELDRDSKESPSPNRCAVGGHGRVDKPSVGEDLQGILIADTVHKTESGAILTDSQIWEDLTHLAKLGKFTTRLPKSCPARVSKKVAECAQLLEDWYSGAISKKYTWDADWLGSKKLTWPKASGRDAVLPILERAAADLLQSRVNEARLFESEDLARFLGARVSPTFDPARPYRSYALEMIAGGPTSSRRFLADHARNRIPSDLLEWLDGRVAEWKRQGLLASCSEDDRIVATKAIADFCQWYDTDGRKVASLSTEGGYKTAFGSIRVALTRAFEWLASRGNPPLSRFFPNPLVQDHRPWGSFEAWMLQSWGVNPRPTPEQIASMERAAVRDSDREWHDALNAARARLDEKYQNAGGVLGSGDEAQLEIYAELIGSRSRNRPMKERALNLARDLLLGDPSLVTSAAWDELLASAEDANLLD